MTKCKTRSEKQREKVEQKKVERGIAIKVEREIYIVRKVQ